MVCILRSTRVARMLSVFLLSGLFAGTVNAATTRYILKNNANTELTVPGAQIVDQFEIGKNHYTVVELQNASTLFGVSLFNSVAQAESVEVDWPIYVDDQDGESEAQSSGAWHVDLLKYNEVQNAPSGEAVIVAVLDTGVDYNHNALAPHMWINPGEIAANEIDDDFNGYVDDVVGWDFDANDNDPMDPNSHGTHCAGIITSSPDPSSGAVGVASQAKIMAVRIIGNQSAGFLSNGAKAIKYAVDNGAHILSNSWRVYRNWSQFDPSDINVALLKDAIAYAEQNNVLFVAATGNESTNIPASNERNPIYPVGFSDLNNLVGVAATTSSDTLAGFSNYGKPYTHVAAPGANIISTVPGNRWSSKSGTSMATPIVAGVLARGLSKGYSPALAVSELVRTSQRIDSMSDKVVAEGRIDLVEYLR